MLIFFLFYLGPRWQSLRRRAAGASRPRASAGRPSPVVPRGCALPPRRGRPRPVASANSAGTTWWSDCIHFDSDRFSLNLSISQSRRQRRHRVAFVGISPKEKKKEKKKKCSLRWRHHFLVKTKQLFGSVEQKNQGNLSIDHDQIINEFENATKSRFWKKKPRIELLLVRPSINY